MIYPLESNITWLSGKDEMTLYSFGPKRVAHSFCPTCGTSIGGKSLDPNFFADNRAINVSLSPLGHVAEERRKGSWGIRADFKRPGADAQRRRHQRAEVKESRREEQLLVNAG
jgi:hypothetical protein